MTDRCSTCTTGCSSGSCPTDQEGRLPPGMLSIYDIDASVADGVLVWIEVSDNNSIEVSIPAAIGKASSMTEGRVFGIIFGDVSRKELYGNIFAYGVDTLYHMRSVELNGFHAHAYAQAIMEVAERINPASILMSATVKGRELAHRTAALFGTDPMDYFGNDPLTATDGPPKIFILESGTSPIPQAHAGRKGTAINLPLSNKVKDALKKEASF